MSSDRDLEIFANALDQYLNTTKDFANQFRARLIANGINSDEIFRIVIHLDECCYQMKLYKENHNNNQ